MMVLIMMTTLGMFKWVMMYVVDVVDDVVEGHCGDDDFGEDEDDVNDDCGNDVDDDNNVVGDVDDVDDDADDDDDVDADIACC